MRAGGKEPLLMSSGTGAAMARPRKATRMVAVSYFMMSKKKTAGRFDGKRKKKGPA
jgi:hypothetical protein